jgi:hypothetical protein
MILRIVYIMIFTLVSIHSGCAPVTTSPPEPASKTPVDLSGDWEYDEESVVQRLTLDTQGNGAYAWQNGRIVTTSVSGGKWTGLWVQEGNDREGGFEVQLSPDTTEAQGTWWYTRIGSTNFSPHERGGDFHLKRTRAVTAVPAR